MPLIFNNQKANVMAWKEFASNCCVGTYAALDSAERAPTPKNSRLSRNKRRQVWNIRLNCWVLRCTERSRLSSSDIFWRDLAEQKAIMDVPSMAVAALNW